MQRFFEAVLEPIFKLENIKTIVEIGAEKGISTAKLIRYANECGGKIYTIDPVPLFDCYSWAKENPDSFVMIKDLSLNVIKDIKDADCFLIDGDHNWYTVYNELKAIYEVYGEERFPLVFFHDILWPYDRRDLYYCPDNIPGIYRHEYDKKAMRPDSKLLCNDGINENLCNAKAYGGEKNGVLTAIEDFVRDYPSLQLKLLTHDVLFGLGVIASEKKYPKALEYFTSFETLKKSMQLCENERVNKSVEIRKLSKRLKSLESSKKKVNTVKIYPDFGNGYNESTAVAAGGFDEESGLYYGSVSFEKPPIGLKLVPACDSFCVVDNLYAMSEKGAVEPTETNGEAYGSTLIFTDKAPQIFFTNTSSSREFAFKAEIYPFDSMTALEFINKLISDNKIFSEESSRLSAENSALSSDNGRLEADNQRLSLENSHLSAEKVRLEEENRQISSDLDKKKTETQSIKKAAEGWKKKLSEAENKNKAYAAEIGRSRNAASGSDAVIKKNRETAQKLFCRSGKKGMKYALRVALKSGPFAAKTNLKAIKELRKNGGFDVLYYCSKNSDVLRKGMDPLVHFIWFGGYEGRNPSEQFDVKKYLDNYSDVKKSGVNPYAHYIVCGKKENRKAFPVQKKTVSSPVKTEIKPNSVNDKNTGISVQLSPEEIVSRYKEFYNYSAQNPMLYPQNSENDLAVEIYMESAGASLRTLYGSMEQDILVSIIMPTYNRAGVIGKAIESVIEQSYKNWELLIIDDMSTDNTGEAIRRYTDADSRIKYMKNTEQKGVCGARNTGLKAAKGQFTAYLDTDNDWDRDYLLLMTQTLKLKPDYSAIFCAQKIYRPENEQMKFQQIRFGVYNHSIIKNRNYIDMNCYMHRRSDYEKYGGFCEELKRFVDWELIHRYSEHCAPYPLPCCLSNYYFDRADNQITRKTSEAYRENIERFDNQIKGAYLDLKSASRLDINGYQFYSDKIEKYDCGKRRVSVIIPSYEALGCLITCIEAIKKFTAEMDYEIIIVDNNSSDIVKQYIRELDKREEKVKVFLNEHNMGFTYAVNQGIEMAMPDSDIILLNNDAIVTDGWIEELYRVKDKTGAGIVVPRQVLIPETKTMTTHVPCGNVRRELDVSVSKHHHNVKDIDKYHQFGFTELTFAPFFLVMITRECFNKLGFLDEKNGRHYKSDRLYCQKAAENNVEIVYTPFSKAYHLLQQSTAELKKSDVQMYKTIFEKNDWSDIGYKEEHRKAPISDEQNKN